MKKILAIIREYEKSNASSEEFKILASQFASGMQLATNRSHEILKKEIKEVIKNYMEARNFPVKFDEIEKIIDNI